MLSPKRTKFRKQHRGRMKGVASRGNKIAFGQFALQAQDCGWVTSRQIEASRRAVSYTHLRAHETDRYLVWRLRYKSLGFQG